MSIELLSILESELRKYLKSMKEGKYSYYEKLDVVVNNETKQIVGTVKELALFISKI